MTNINVKCIIHKRNKITNGAVSWFVDAGKKEFIEQASIIGDTIEIQTNWINAVDWYSPAKLITRNNEKYLIVKLDPNNDTGKIGFYFSSFSLTGKAESEHWEFAELFWQSKL